MRKIFTNLDARPHFIKASVVSNAIAQQSGVKEIVVHMGQHFDVNMSDRCFQELGMAKPDYYLNIHGGRYCAMTGRMLAELQRVLLKEKLDAVMVYGDTNSTLAGALAAAKLKILVAHVETGMRSFNMAMPEEINRMLTDRISQWLFTPTQTTADHLLREGFAPDRIIPVGDVMYDVALHHGAREKAETGLMARLGLEENGYVLATVHRAENTDNSQRLTAIVDALIATTQTLPVVWPLHPRTHAVLQQADKLHALENAVHLIEPVGYLDMVQLEKFAALIATDSGGVQKEAFFYKVPCVTLRYETEWVELVQARWNRLASLLNHQSVHAALLDALQLRGLETNPYGAGDAAKKIAGELVRGIQ